MTKISAPFGSDTWIDTVFKSGPVRQIKSRSRRTHRHLLWLFALNRLGYVESRNELIGVLALEYLTQIGTVIRFKEQPFTAGPELWSNTHEDAVPDLGKRGYTPDFLAISQTGEKFVIEVKAARFITREQEKDFELWKQMFAQMGFKFLLWTDRTGLTGALRSNLLRMRRAAVLNFEADEQSRLEDLLKSKGPQPLGALYERDIDIDLIAFAAWKGKVHFSLQQALTGHSLIGLEPFEDLGETLFGIAPDMFRWWNALAAA